MDPRPSPPERGHAPPPRSRSRQTVTTRFAFPNRPPHHAGTPPRAHTTPKSRRLPKDNHPCCIALTGDPGGGKTTAADLFRREIGDRVVIVPEAATMLFSGGFPRGTSKRAIQSSQSAIYQVQRHLEDIQHASYPDRILLWDRGTIDGAAYWPGKPDGFFHAIGSSLESELLRYDAVIFFETAAAGGMSIEGGNPVRTENNLQAVALDSRLRALWQRHPRFILVPHNPSFFKKITFGLAALV